MSERAKFHLEETATALHQAVFTLLAEQPVWLPGMLLETVRVLSGTALPCQAGAGEATEATLRCRLRAVRPEVPEMIFPLGGQSDVTATERRNAICSASDGPRNRTFSFGRALQDAAMKSWADSPANRVTAQAAPHHRARRNSLAVQGKYSAEIEGKPLANI